MTTYEPYGKWPRHDNDAWNTTYDEAKARSWRLRKHSNHNTSYLLCPTGDCELGPIWSTGKGTESVAKDYLRDVRNCPHGEAEQTTRAQRTEDHLRWGETYADAACHQLEARSARADIEELWQEAEHQADAADQVLHGTTGDSADNLGGTPGDARDDDAIMADLQAKEWWAEHYEEQAQEALADTKLAGATDPVIVVQAAEDAAEDAADALADVSQNHDDYAPLEARLEALREKSGAIRVQIDEQGTDI